MPKASINLPDGTTVVIEGSPEEVAKLLQLYGGGSSKKPESNSPPNKSKRKSPKKKAVAKSVAESPEDNSVDLMRIIEVIRNCDEAEAIEANVLDKTGQVNRILLPLYVVHEHLDNAFALSSGEISRITTDLGVPVQTPNASRTLSGTASKYVIGDSVRKKGQTVRYKLSRRGVQYLSEVLSDNSNGK